MTIAERPDSTSLTRAPAIGLPFLSTTVPVTITGFRSFSRTLSSSRLRFSLNGPASAEPRSPLTRSQTGSFSGGKPSMAKAPLASVVA